MNVLLEQVNSIGKAFVEFAVPMLVQSGVLIVILLLIDLALRKKVKAVFRYCIWMLILLKLILPTSLSSPLSLGYWFGDHLAYVAESRTTAAPEPEAEEPALANMLHIIEPVPIEVERPAPAVLPMMPDVEPAVTEAVGPPAAPVTPVTWQGVVFLLWLAVVIALGLLLLQRAMFVRGLVAQAKEANALMNDALEYCCKCMGVKRKVGLKVSANAASPAVCGLFRPVILLPHKLAPSLGSRGLRAVLLHELAHIRRGDLWVNLAQTVLQIMYFYNPLLWLANAMIRRVREQAIDETVLVRLRRMGEKAQQYPQTLVNVAKLAFKRPVLSLRLIGVVESKSALAGRIKHILNRPMPKSAKIGIVGVLAVIIAGAVLLPMAKAKENQKALRGIDEKLNVSDKAGELTINSLYMTSPDGKSLLGNNSVTLSVGVTNNSQKEIYLGFEYYTDSGTVAKVFSPGASSLAQIRRVASNWQGRIEFPIRYNRFVKGGYVKITLAKCSGNQLKEATLAFLPVDSEVLHEKKYVIFPCEKEKASKEPTFKKSLPNGVTVELVGVCEHPSEGKQWWRPDGSLLEEAPYDDDFGRAFPQDGEKGYKFAVKYSGLAGKEVDARVIPTDFKTTNGGALFSTSEKNGKENTKYVEGLLDEKIVWLGAAFDEKLGHCDIRIGVCRGDWKSDYRYKTDQPNDIVEWVEFKNVSLKPNFKTDVQVEVEKAAEHSKAEVGHHMTFTMPIYDRNASNFGQYIGGNLSRFDTDYIKLERYGLTVGASPEELFEKQGKCAFYMKKDHEFVGVRGTMVAPISVPNPEPEKKPTLVDRLELMSKEQIIKQIKDYLANNRSNISIKLKEGMICGVITPEKRLVVMKVYKFGTYESGAEATTLTFLDLGKVKDDKETDVQVEGEGSKGQGKLRDQEEPTYGGRSLTELVSALSDHDFQTKINAVYHLGYIGPKAKPAVPALVNALNQEPLRESVLHSLGNIGVGAEEAIPALMKAIAEYPSACRWHAAVALANIGNGAVASLEKGTKSEKMYLRIWCNAALAKQKEFDSPNLRYLAQLMKNTDKNTAGEAVRALTMLGPISKPLVPDLIEALKHSVVPKKHIAFALAQTGKDARPAVPELIKLVQDADLGTRADAIYALSEIGSMGAAPAVPLLIQALKTNDGSDAVMASRIRYTAATALGNIGPDARPAIPELVIALSDENEFVRANSAEAIGDIDPTDLRNVPALIEAMTDESGRVRSAAAQSLVKVGPVDKEVILAFINAADDNWKGVRYACDTFFTYLGPEHSFIVPDLIEMLKTPNEREQRLAITALGNMGEAAVPAVPYLAKNIKNPRLESVASGALRKLGPKAGAAVPGLIEMLNNIS